MRRCPPGNGLHEARAVSAKMVTHLCIDARAPIGSVRAVPISTFPLPFAGEGGPVRARVRGQMARDHFLTGRARSLRRNATEAEKLLWRHLRNRELGGFKFRRQVQIDHYIVDFLCPLARLIIELDGGQHNSEVDAARTAFLEGQGFRVIRFWNNDVMKDIDNVIRAIIQAMDSERPLSDQS